MLSMKIRAVHHIKLTVSDLEKSKQFYAKLPGFKVVAYHPDFIMFSCGNFYLGLTTHLGELTLEKFSEHNVGLDHIAFEVSSKNDLDEALEFFEKEKIEHGEIKELSNGTCVLSFRDPDNIQLEFAYKE